MDPFEVRIQFLTLLRRLNASQQSIQKVVGYALKYFSGCGEDLWDCIVEECQKGSINNRINILYLLDSLCETSLLARSHSGTVVQDGSQTSSLYVDYVTRDLGKIVDYVVPEGRQGLPNLMSTKQILESWRSKRVLDPQKVDDVLATLDSRRASLESSATEPSATTQSSTPSTSLPRNEVFKRIEEDRERHKRLRERRWVQPISHNPHAHLPPQLASFMPLTDDGDGEEELTLDIEFENDWETTSDWNEDDDDAVVEENELCLPSHSHDEDGEQVMDLS
ncbi:CTD kinase subunit gamma [Sparassis crispa]|uniref:CTD kinase subunit gamma n=1 Tax=Sparassis crispa TaxID=139825 RepID=A0A401GFE2_9APHY|nr:CTD kinase subunit gamma [Sparassis crispa]GBE80906.1 CTD kinase subunit gamma [Sparassis crispa]